MPHQCTDCGRAFEDGSKEMLSGCPDCGGNTFQFRPEGASGGDGPDEAAEPPEPPEPPADSSVARTVGNAATVVRDIVSSEKPEKPDPPESSSRPREPELQSSEDPAVQSHPEPDREDAAQASARSEVVSPEDLPEAERTETTRSHPTPVLDDGAEQSKAERRADRDRPDLSELREKLNDQFESIKVIEPGQYELNLMELYDREEYIIALQEDGKYTIQVPERWNDG